MKGALRSRAPIGHRPPTRGPAKPTRELDEIGSLLRDLFIRPDWADQRLGCAYAAEKASLRFGA
jgi:hypothetical protein